MRQDHFNFDTWLAQLVNVFIILAWLNGHLCYPASLEVCEREQDIVIASGSSRDRQGSS